MMEQGAVAIDPEHDSREIIVTRTAPASDTDFGFATNRRTAIGEQLERGGGLLAL